MTCVTPYWALVTSNAEAKPVALLNTWLDNDRVRVSVSLPVVGVVVEVVVVGTASSTEPRWLPFFIASVVSLRPRSDGWRLSKSRGAVRSSLLCLVLCHRIRRRRHRCIAATIK